jgi:hypothetical protein
MKLSPRTCFIATACIVRLHVVRFGFLLKYSEDVSASTTCGNCNGSVGLMYRSKSIEGPWTRQIIAGDSCQGQVEGMLPITNPTTGEITYVWHSTSVRKYNSLEIRDLN